MENNSVEWGTWADIIVELEKRIVKEVIEKSLNERDNEEKEKLNRRRNITVFELSESKKLKPEDRKEENIKKFIGLCKRIIKITFDQGLIEFAIRLGKATNKNQWPLLISLKDESKKWEILNRESEGPFNTFNKINTGHDLRKKEKEALLNFCAKGRTENIQ